MSEATLAADVAEALEELERAFDGAVVEDADGAGGAYVTVDGIDLGDGWSAESAPLTFHLPYNYPAAAPYPYYLPGELQRTGGWPAALQRIRWRDRDVIQVSLRHNRWDPERDRVTGCLLQVAEWLRSQ